jgi:hypothetical protein
VKFVITNEAFPISPISSSRISVTLSFHATELCEALTVLGCLIAWKNRYWRLSGHVHYSLVALAGVGFVALLYYWNFLTFGFRDIL